MICVAFSEDFEVLETRIVIRERFKSSEIESVQAW